jgi:transposase-like protein
MDGRVRAPGTPDGDHLRQAALAALEKLDNGRISACPHCRESAVLRWGKARSDVQRWLCRACERTFSATTGSLLAGVHAPDKLRLVLLDMVSGQPSSCRCLAAALSVSAMTIWNWRQRVTRAFARIAAAEQDETPVPVAAGTTTLLRESRKASREWVDHQRGPACHPRPDRLRWVDYRERRLALPRPMAPVLLAVRLAERGRGGWRATVLPLTAAEQASWGVARTTATPPTEPQPPAAGGRASPGATPSPAAGDALIARLRAFLRPFCGPAKQHLGGYAVWFVAWQAATTEVERHTLALQAWRALATATNTILDMALTTGPSRHPTDIAAAP